MRRLAHRRGATAIEFALLLPVFCAILFGVMEYAWVFYQQSNVVAATRDALRVAVTLPKTNDPEPAIAAFDEVRPVFRSLLLGEERTDEERRAGDVREVIARAAAPR